MPTYRNYFFLSLVQISKYFQETQKGVAPNSNIEIFSKFLDTKKIFQTKLKITF